MPLDAYSLCPCGTGKKIKFCCPDLLSELQKIERMMEAQQYLGCLQHIEQVLQQHPDRACLLAINGMLLRATGREEEANANAATFIEKHPENPTAMADAAVAAATAGDGRAARETLQRAIAVSEGKISSNIYEAMFVVADGLLSHGEWLAARALVELQLGISSDDSRPLEMLVELNRSPEVPLLLKDDPSVEIEPGTEPWRLQHKEATDLMHRGDWLAAAERLSKLAEDMPELPAVWRGLATLRGWLADTPGCIEALRKFATLDVPTEDAVEALARAMILSDDPLGDSLDVYSLQWEVTDVEQLQAALSLQQRAMQLPPQALQAFEDGGPPPKAIFLLLNRPTAAAAKDLAAADVSHLLGQMVLFGRQTDREARLEVRGVTADDLEQTKSLIAEMAGEAVAADVKQEVSGQVTATEDLLQHRMRPPADTTEEQFEALAAEHQRDALLNRWPDLKMGIFDGKSPREVAGDESRRIDLLAAIMLIEAFCDRTPYQFDFNELRSALGLPVLEPIDPEQHAIQKLPPVRLSRVIVEKLSDEDLVFSFRRAVTFGAKVGLQKLATAIVDRPSMAGRDERLGAYRYLAQTSRDPEQALGYVDQGREATEAAGQSPATWLLMELSIRFARREAEHVNRLIGQIQSRHLEEPGVAEALTQFLVGVGALRPDGTPAAPPQAGPAPPVTAEEAAAEADKIWTPGSEQSGGGKLWTPD